MTTKRVAKNPKSTRWVFTLNNPEFPVTYNQSNQIYYVYGNEVGESGTPHHQGFIVFDKQKYLTQVKELNDKAHWEIAKGTNKQASDYCKKDGDFVEKGTLPEEPSRLGAKANKDKWRIINDLAKNGELQLIDEQFPKVWNTSYRNLKSIKVDHMKPLGNLEEPCGVWITGPSGAGKTMKSRTDYPDHYLKLPNKWWDGYQGEPNVILDDLDRNHAYMGYHLKIWADRYSHLAETKGSTIVVRPRKFIVTSQYTIEDIWFNEPETIAALQRRFKVVKINSSDWKNTIDKYLNKKPPVIELTESVNDLLTPKESTQDIEVVEISDGEAEAIQELEEIALKKKNVPPTLNVSFDTKITPPRTCNGEWPVSKTPIERRNAKTPEDWEKLKPNKLRPPNPYFPDVSPLSFRPPSWKSQNLAKQRLLEKKKIQKRKRNPTIKQRVRKIQKYCSSSSDESEGESIDSSDSVQSLMELYDIGESDDEYTPPKLECSEEMPTITDSDEEEEGKDDDGDIVIEEESEEY